MRVTFNNVRISLSQEEHEAALLEFIKKSVPVTSEVDIIVTFPNASRKEVIVDLLLKEAIPTTATAESTPQIVPETPTKRPVGRPKNTEVVEKPIPEIEPEPSVKEVTVTEETTDSPKEESKKSLFKNLHRG